MEKFDTSLLINYYFNEISKIPRGSYYEEKIADYVESIAIKYHLKYWRDEMNNLIVFKEATLGYGNHDAIMLQAHMDMVNEKNDDSTHDFNNDPLHLYVEDGFLRASGTTLGGDDGYGVSYMLAILTEHNIKHPPLECVFTVQEEVGLYGADFLDVSRLKAKRMIGLDSDEEGKICTSSAGGNDLLITKPIIGENNNSPVYVLEVKGLLGGHSGGCIHMGRGNANKIVARILCSLLNEAIDIRLVDITGGLKNNAIPRECTAVFASSSDKEMIYELVQSCYHDIALELENSDPQLTISLHEDTCDVCICSQDSEAIISIMYLGLNGMLEQSQVIDGLTTLSLNMGVVRTHEDCITIDYSIRSPLFSARNELSRQLEMIAGIYNAYVEVSGDYPGWDYDAHSMLRGQLKEFYKKTTHHELKEVATHGGLEIGIFKNKIPELDIVTIGPHIYDIHTPDERMDLHSFIKTYQLLVSFLETL